MGLTLTEVTKASKAYTGSTEADTETVTVGGVTYTYQTTLTNTAGNVHVGTDDTGTISNLCAAINLSNEGESEVGAGTDYASATAVNPEVTATCDGAVLTVTAKVGGTVGNFISCSEAAGGAWAGGVTALSGGTGSMAVAAAETSAFLQSIREDSTCSVPSGVITDLLSAEAALDAID